MKTLYLQLARQFKFKKEGRQKRIQAEAQLRELENKLKESLLESVNSRADVGEEQNNNSYDRLV